MKEWPWLLLDEPAVEGTRLAAYLRLPAFTDRRWRRRKSAALALFPHPDIEHQRRSPLREVSRKYRAHVGHAHFRMSLTMSLPKSCTASRARLTRSALAGPVSTAVPSRLNWGTAGVPAAISFRVCRASLILAPPLPAARV